MKKKHPQTTHLFDSIAPAIAMQITVAEYTGNRLVLQAPLAPNLNDKGTAFAGSISSILALAGWGLITLRLSDAGICTMVAVTQSETGYQRPVKSDLRAVAEISDTAVEQLVAQLSDGNRGWIDIRAELWSADDLCATMDAHYVAFPDTGK